MTLIKIRVHSVDFIDPLNLISALNGHEVIREYECIRDYWGADQTDHEYNASKYLRDLQIRKSDGYGRHYCRLGEFCHITSYDFIPKFESEIRKYLMDQSSKFSGLFVSDSEKEHMIRINKGATFYSGFTKDKPGVPLEYKSPNPSEIEFFGSNTLTGNGHAHNNTIAQFGNTVELSESEKTELGVLKTNDILLYPERFHIASTFHIYNGPTINTVDMFKHERNFIRGHNLLLA